MNADEMNSMLRNNPDWNHYAFSYYNAHAMPHRRVQKTLLLYFPDLLLEFDFESVIFFRRWYLPSV